jgi:hypothetical protein
MPTWDQIKWIPYTSIVASGLFLFWRVLAGVLDAWEHRRQQRFRAAYELARMKRLDAQLDVKDGPWRPDMTRTDVMGDGLPMVVRVVPFDFAAARRVQERLKAEEAFVTTTWGEQGKRH